MQFFIEGYVAFYVYRLFCTNSVKVYTEYLKILKNVHLSAVTFNTKDYSLFLFKDILQISEKNWNNIHQSYSVHYLQRSSYKYRQ